MHSWKNDGSFNQILLRRFIEQFYAWFSFIMNVDRYMLSNKPTSNNRGSLLIASNISVPIASGNFSKSVKGISLSSGVARYFNVGWINTLNLVNEII